MKLYVVRNKEGKFFRPRGLNSSANNWQDLLEKAKFYPKIGTAKGQASFWYREYPKFGCPDILEFDVNVTHAKILDIKAETDLKILKKEQEAALRKKYFESQYVKRL